MRVWLSEHEVEILIDTAPHARAAIAFALGARCGLRSHEIVQVYADDIRSTEMGSMLRVQHGKGDKYRETPMPTDLRIRIETAMDYRDAPSHEPVILGQGRTGQMSTRTLRRWMDDTKTQCANITGDENWHHLTMHDLRRTWATSLASEDVDPLIVCDWGGWSDLRTFLRAYQGVYSPEAHKRERAKVDWLQ